MNTRTRGSSLTVSKVSAGVRLEGRAWTVGATPVARCGVGWVVISWFQIAGLVPFTAGRAEVGSARILSRNHRSVKRERLGNRSPPGPGSRQTGVAFPLRLDAGRPGVSSRSQHFVRIHVGLYPHRTGPRLGLCPAETE